MLIGRLKSFMGISTADNQTISNISLLTTWEDYLIQTFTITTTCWSPKRITSFKPTHWKSAHLNIVGTKVFAADALMTMNRSFNVSLRFTVQWKLVWQKNPWHRQIKVKALPFMYIYICNIHVLIMKTFIKEFDGERIILDERKQILQSNSVSIKCKAALNLSFSFLAWNKILNQI